MPKYLVEDSQTGRKFELEGDSPPTEQELGEIFDSQGPSEPSGSAPGRTVGDWVTEKAKGALGTVVDFEKGVAKGAGETAQGLGKLVNKGTGALADLFGRDAWAGKDVKGGVSDAIMPGAIDQKLDELQATNTAQKAGKTAEHIAEYFLPGSALKSLKHAGLLKHALREGLASGAVATAQEGEIGAKSALAAAVGGSVPLVGAGLSKAATTGADLLKNRAARETIERISKSLAGKKRLDRLLKNKDLAKDPAAQEALAQLSQSGGGLTVDSAVGGVQGAAGTLLGGAEGYRRGGIKGAIAGAAGGRTASGAISKLLETPGGLQALARLLERFGRGAKPVGNSPLTHAGVESQLAAH